MRSLIPRPPLSFVRALAAAQWEQIVFFVTKSYISRSSKDIFNFFVLNKGGDM